MARVFCLGFYCAVSGRPSFDVLSYYETLDYDPSVLRSQHLRVTRDVPSLRVTRDRSNKVPESVHLHINAFNR